MKISCINQEKNLLMQVGTKMVHGQTTRNNFSQDSSWLRVEKETHLTSYNIFCD
jgi:hypothetical protein